MGFIKFVIWTACAMALGVYISTARYENGTPLEQMQRLWKQHGPSETVVRQNVKGAVEKAKALPARLDKAAAAPAKGAAAEKPEEHHTPEEREAVNKLIAQRAQGK